MLRAIKKALKQNKVYANIVSVAKSGMSRRVKFYIVYDGNIVEITNELEAIIDCKNIKELDLENITYHDRGTIIRGCGMDVVGFHLYCCARKFDKNAKFSGRWSRL